ncbi:MAG: ABC transporter permease [Eubacteriales bacterium]
MNKKKSFLKSEGGQAIIASLICVVLGLLIGFIVLLCINPAGAGKAILDMVKNFLTYKSHSMRLKYFGSTLVKTAPLVLCSLSILFCYKVGLFNIGAAGQYAIGAGMALYAALAWNLPWWACIIIAALGGAVLGTISGVLKAYCNVNEVISGIMLNWISLYCMNMLLTRVKEDTSPYTKNLASVNRNAIIPSLGLDKLFSENKYVTIAIPISILVAIVVWVVLEKTKFGYELKATGYNKHAAKYCGMAEKRNMIITLSIGGAIAGLGAAMFYLTGIEQWNCSQSSVPAMGFSGIAAAFLGGLSPIGAIFSSYFIQHITEGGGMVDLTVYSAQIADLVSAIIIYLCGFVFFMKHVMKRIIAKREEAAERAEAEKASGEVTSENVTTEDREKGGDDK